MLKNIFRYQVDEDSEYPGLQQKEAEKTMEQSLFDSFKDIFNLNNNKYPTTTTSHIVNWSITLFSKYIFFKYVRFLT